MITNNRCFTKPTLINPTGIMIHSVGCAQPVKEVFINQWNSQSAQVSVHAIADDKGVAQLLPYNYKAWHCGGSGNNNLLSIEITEPKNMIYIDGKLTSYYAPDGFNHFRKAVSNAVKWTVERCLEFNILVDNIITHADGYKLGVASNHGDPDHWWKYHNYTIDDFRQEVYNMINSDIRYHTLEEVPDYFKPYIKKLMDKGYLKGTNGDLDLSMDMIRTLVITGRMVGIFYEL